ncbi:MAG: Substrate-binding region of ABC-type glycine betaine transport system [Gammaproteobacteria bacterium]|nr:Substrate-binding region of ABC-type glycine betaine transport system [Gammaproteobacteria bacterium]
MTCRPLLIMAVLICGISMPAWADPVTIGSKQFTENIIIAEIVTRLLNHQGLAVEHKKGLGGTRILWDALVQGEIDIYPEYTGTLSQELLTGTHSSDLQQLRTVLATYRISMSAPLGFNNSYVLGMRGQTARDLKIGTITDLQRYPELRFGFSNEFMSRIDGWPGLRDRYQLQQLQVIGLDHDLAYRGLTQAQLDVIDLYATDAEIAYYGIQPLYDDQGYFPAYLAVILYRQSLAVEYPDIPELISSLAGRIDTAHMSAMNAEVKLNGLTEQRVAAAYLEDEFGMHVVVRDIKILDTLIRNTLDHLWLVLISLTTAIIAGIPLGIIAARHLHIGRIVLAVAGIIQTIPALALLVFMIPLLGIGGPPAVAALFLYSLLPIIRNTYSGLHDIPPPLLESAVAMGLPTLARMRLVELPLALRSILSGIKISAVINVGTATLGALIGAGGYGQPILTGIRLNDVSLILQGAIPAALLALLVQGFFTIIENRLMPWGLRYPGSEV